MTITPIYNVYKHNNNSQTFINARSWPLCRVTQNNEQTYNITFFEKISKVVTKYNTHPEKYSGIFSFNEVDETVLRRSTDFKIKLMAQYNNYDNDIMLFILLTKSEKTVTKNELFDILVGDYKYQPESFIQIYGQVEPTNNQVISCQSYNNWIINFDTRINNQFNISDIKALLDETQKILHNKNLDFLAYGQVYILNQLNHNTLADYMKRDDLIRLGIQKKQKISDLTKTVLHELGHRHYDKFLLKEKRNEINTFFCTKKKRDSSIKVNDFVIERTTGNKYQIIGTKFSRELYYTLKLIKLGDKCKKNDKIDNKIGTAADNIGIVFQSTNQYYENTVFFPTNYSLTNPEEFYAELFSLWLLNKLDPPVKNWFESIIFTNNNIVDT